MGVSSVGHGGHVPPRFLNINKKSLILTIGAPQIYNLRLLCPQILIVHSQIVMPTPAYVRHIQ